MDPYIAVLAGFGAVVLLTAWLPMVLKELPLTLPIVCVALGAGLFAFPEVSGTGPHPQDHLELTERLTEFVVIVALMGAGLKLDRPFDATARRLTAGLLGIAMPLTILVIAVLAAALLGVGAAAALLLGAALAPTDPVLASDVQVGPPGEGREDEVRYALTAEAGLNDGLAFPFVNLAVAIAVAETTGEPWLLRWLGYDVLWKLAAGTAVGAALGGFLGWLTFRLPDRARISRTGDGFVALGITAVVYGVTEMLHGYGFLAVFVAALAFRSVERDHGYHQKLHEFIEQFERLLMMLLLVLFGASISGGDLLREMNARTVAFAAAVLFVARPLIGWIALSGARLPAAERFVIAFFGIRGLGSPYYLAYGLGHAEFEDPRGLWSALALVVVISVVLHGVTVTPVMRRIDRGRARDVPGEEGAR